MLVLGAVQRAGRRQGAADRGQPTALDQIAPRPAQLADGAQVAGSRQPVQPAAGRRRCDAEQDRDLRREHESMPRRELEQAPVTLAEGHAPALRRVVLPAEAAVIVHDDLSAEPTQVRPPGPKN